MSFALSQPDVRTPGGGNGLSPGVGVMSGSEDSWLPPTLVALGAVLVYLTSLANGFAYDDVSVVLENPAVHDLTNPLRIWFTPYWPGAAARPAGLYRPLTIFLFAAQWSVGGGAPLIFHLLNVVLHAVTSVLVFYLIRTLVEWRSALGAALLFAVHPVHVEAVANIVGQAELVSSCLVLSALVVYLRRPLVGEVTSWRRWLIATCFLLSLFSKEHAIVLPGLLLILDAAQGRLRRPGYVRSVAKLGILLAGITCVYFVLRSLVLGGSLSGDVTFSLPSLRDPPTRLLTALSVWPEYVRLMVVPFQLSAMYDPDTIPFLTTVTPSVVAGSVLLLLVTVTAVLPSAWPAVGLGSAWFLTAILLVSNLLFPIGTVLGERTLYLPSVALSIWAGFGLRWFLDRDPARRLMERAVLVGVLGVVVLFGTRTTMRNPVWSDNETLFETTFRDHPESFRAQWFHAAYLAEMGDSAGSVRHWRKALEIYPDSPGLLTAYAGFLFVGGDPRGADDVAARALDVHPDAPNALFLQGLIDIALDRRPEAQRRVDRLVELGFLGIAEQLADSLTARSLPR